MAQQDLYIDSPDADSSGIGASSRTNLIRFIVLGVVAIMALGYMIFAAFPANAQYFLTVGEFMERPDVQDGRVVRVSGKLVEGSFSRQEGPALSSSFILSDKDPGNSASWLHASYEGVLPDLFFNPHSEIILQGSYGPERIFQTDDILVKCPSKYQSLEEEYPEQGPAQEYGPQDAAQSG